MAVNILIGKSRHQSRSDREREKLQAQISTYALRFHAEHDARERSLALARLEAQPPTRIDTTERLDTFIEQVSRIVDVVLPARVLAMILGAVLICGGLVGCESEADHQHHLYNVQKCVEQTNQADGVLVATTEDGMDSNFDVDQRSHDRRAAECMANVEHTTQEFQQQKHDDYGKPCARESNGYCYVFAKGGK